MKIAATVLVLATATAFATTNAHAKHYHHHHYAHHHYRKHVETGERVFYSKPAYEDVADADQRYLHASLSGYRAYASYTPEETTKSHERHVDYAGGGGLVRSHKTGATARVSFRAAGAMQSYIDDIEANGGTVYFMGGNRAGHCSPRHMHSCGLALDVCQLSRGVVASKCHLPGPGALAEIAARHGLFEGGQWCNSDYGHAQLGVSAAACGNILMARRHYRHRHYASR